MPLSPALSQLLGYHNSAQPIPSFRATMSNSTVVDAAAPIASFFNTYFLSDEQFSQLYYHSIHKQTYNYVMQHSTAFLLLPLLSFLWLLYYLSYHVRKPHTVYALNALNMKIVEALPRLHRAYWPTFYVTHELPQAAIGSFVRLDPHIKRDRYFEREIRTMKDGEQLALDWLNDGTFNDTTPIIFTCHGLAGHTDELNMQYLALEIRSAGFRFAIMNRRGCALDMKLSRSFLYEWGCTSDMREVLQHIKTRYPNAPLFGVGYSAGSNLLTKYLGETGSESLLDAGLSVANAYNVELCSEYLARKPLHSYAMVNILKNMLERNKDIFIELEKRLEKEALEEEKRNEEMRKRGEVSPVVSSNETSPSPSPTNGESSSTLSSSSSSLQRQSSAGTRKRLNLKKVHKVKSVKEWDQHFSLITHTKYDNLTDFYHHQSTTNEMIANISVPLFNLHSLDDPIIPDEIVPHAALNANENIFVCTTVRGGHLGYTEGLFPFATSTWMEKLTVEYFKVLIGDPEIWKGVKERKMKAKEEGKMDLTKRERAITPPSATAALAALNDMPSLEDPQHHFDHRPIPAGVTVTGGIHHHPMNAPVAATTAAVSSLSTVPRFFNNPYLPQSLRNRNGEFMNVQQQPEIESTPPRTTTAEPASANNNNNHNTNNTQFFPHHQHHDSTASYLQDFGGSDLDTNASILYDPSLSQSHELTAGGADGGTTQNEDPSQDSSNDTVDTQVLTRVDSNRSHQNQSHTSTSRSFSIVSDVDDATNQLNQRSFSRTVSQLPPILAPIVSLPHRTHSSSSAASSSHHPPHHPISTAAAALPRLSPLITPATFSSLDDIGESPLASPQHEDLIPFTPEPSANTHHHHHHTHAHQHHHHQQEQSQSSLQAFDVAEDETSSASSSAEAEEKEEVEEKKENNVVASASSSSSNQQMDIDPDDDDEANVQPTQILPSIDHNENVEEEEEEEQEIPEMDRVKTTIVTQPHVRASSSSASSSASAIGAAAVAPSGGATAVSFDFDSFSVAPASAVQRTASSSSSQHQPLQSPSKRRKIDADHEISLHPHSSHHHNKTSSIVSNVDEESGGGGGGGESGSEDERHEEQQEESKSNVRSTPAKRPLR